MLDRQQLEALLARRFPGANAAQLAAAANAIMAMDRCAENSPDTDRPLQGVRGPWSACDLPMPRS